MELFNVFMSSHHFVREGQEPALLVIDALPDEHLMAILEWSPLVLVSAAAMPKVASWGIRVDALCSDDAAHNDSVANEWVPQVGPLAVIDISKSLVPTILSYLRNRGQRALHIMTAVPEDNLHLWDEAGDFPITLFNESMKWSRLPGGRFEKWIPEAAVLYVRSGGEVAVSGARRYADQIVAEQDGLVSIISSAPIWVGECLY